MAKPATVDDAGEEDGTPAEEAAGVPEHRESAARLEVRKAAAHVAVEAGKRTGRPVNPKVKELAES